MGTRRETEREGHKLPHCLLCKTHIMTLFMWVTVKSFPSPVNDLDTIPREILLPLSLSPVLVDRLIAFKS